MVGLSQDGLWDFTKEMLSTEDENMKLTQVLRMPLRNYGLNKHKPNEKSQQSINFIISQSLYARAIPLQSYTEKI